MDRETDEDRPSSELPEEQDSESELSRIKKEAEQKLTVAEFVGPLACDDSVIRSLNEEVPDEVKTRLCQEVERMSTPALMGGLRNIINGLHGRWNGRRLRKCDLDRMRFETIRELWHYVDTWKRYMGLSCARNIYPGIHAFMYEDPSNPESGTESDTEAPVDDDDDDINGDVSSSTPANPGQRFKLPGPLYTITHDSTVSSSAQRKIPIDGLINQPPSSVSQADNMPTASSHGHTVSEMKNVLASSVEQANSLSAPVQRDSSPFPKRSSVPHSAHHTLIPPNYEEYNPYPPWFYEGPYSLVCWPDSQSFIDPYSSPASSKVSDAAPSSKVSDAADSSKVSDAAASSKVSDDAAASSTVIDAASSKVSDDDDDAASSTVPDAAASSTVLDDAASSKVPDDDDAASKVPGDAVASKVPDAAASTPITDDAASYSIHTSAVSSSIPTSAVSSSIPTFAASSPSSFCARDHMKWNFPLTHVDDLLPSANTIGLFPKHVKNPERPLDLSGPPRLNYRSMPSSTVTSQMLSAAEQDIQSSFELRHATCPRMGTMGPPLHLSCGLATLRSNYRIPPSSTVTSQMLASGGNRFLASSSSDIGNVASSTRMGFLGLSSPFICEVSSSRRNHRVPPSSTVTSQMLASGEVSDFGSSFIEQGSVITSSGVGATGPSLFLDTLRHKRENDSDEPPAKKIKGPFNMY